MLRTIGSGRREPRYSAATVCQYWIPQPMTKEIINAWAESFDGDVEVAYEDDCDVGVNEQQTKDHMRSVDGNPSSLDQIKDNIKCSNIEYYDSVGNSKM